jgi:PHP family Zn ribbon phosphoesterase
MCRGVIVRLTEEQIRGLTIDHDSNGCTEYSGINQNSYQIVSCIACKKPSGKYLQLGCLRESNEDVMKRYQLHCKDCGGTDDEGIRSCIIL